MKGFLRWLNNLLTAKEQGALLFLCAFGLLGLALTQLNAVLPQKEIEIQQEEKLEQAVKTDKVIQIDVRTATQEELVLLPGIGEKRAKDIIDYRKVHPFQSVNDLLEIKGIGPKTLAKMLSLLAPFGVSWSADSLAIVSENIQPTELKSASQADPTSAPEKQDRQVSPSKSELTSIVNLNKASLDELCTLPGIGPVKAQAIIDYRKQSGGFSSIEEIVKVKGIGAKTLEKIRARLSI
jgi:competence protein ComEA